MSVKQRLSDSRRECVVCRADQSCLGGGGEETERRFIEPWHQPGMLLISPWHQPWQAGTRDMRRRQGAQNRPDPSEVGGREYRRVPLRERKSNPKRAEDERCAQGSA